MFCKHRINLLIKYQHCANIIINKPFHLTYINHVRKPLSSRRALTPSYEDVQEHTVSGIFHDTPENVDAFTNFYGVEGDDGVIDVDELEKPDKSMNRLQKMTSHQQPIDEFRSFNFGAIRLDNENKPSFNVKSRKVKIDVNASQKLTEEKNDELPKDHSNFKNLEASNDYVSKQNQFVTHNAPKISESFIDKYYLAEACSENNAPPVRKLTENSPKAHKFRGENMRTSEILPKPSVHDKEKYTVVNTIESNNIQSDENNVSKSCAKNHSGHVKVSESFIDEHYFPDNYMDNSVPKVERHLNKFIENQYISKSNEFQSVDENVIKSHLQNQFDSSKVSESYIDKEYFADNYTENSVPQVEKPSDNYIERQYFNMDALKPDCEIASASQNNENYPDEKLEESFVSINDNTKISEVNDNSNFESQKSIRENSTNYEKEAKFNHNDNNQDITKTPYDLTSSDIIYKQQRENLRKKFDQHNASILKTDLRKENKKSSQVFSRTKNLNEEVNSETTPISLKNSQEITSSVQSKSESAFDFVKKLRKNHLLSDEVKKGISAKKEKKVDSKGFRILKHQVPSLQYFTKDEMLELLKGCILYSDENTVVLNKPYNLVIHESSTSQELACLSNYLDDLAKILDKTTNSPKLYTVHRLDKETTGCLLLARNEVSAVRLKSLFAQRKIVKTYWIVTTKVPDPIEGIIDIPISEGKIENRSRMVLHPKLPDEIPYANHSKIGKQAITQYSVIAVSGNAALVEVRPETGIKHQIRVHFGFGLGCPILGDHKYSHLDKLVPQKLQSDLLQRLQVRQSKVRHIPLHIHSKHILIPQYSSDRNLFVTAPLPHHMSENLQFLKFKKKK